MSQSERSTDVDQPDRSDESSDNTLRIIDPKDFNQNQRLKEIHRARQNVATALTDRQEYATKEEHIQFRSNLCRAVSLYVMELEPIMKKSDVDPELFTFPENSPFKSIFEYAYSLGYNENLKPSHDVVSMSVFQRCNQFMAEVGLDLDLDHQPEPGYLDL